MLFILVHRFFRWEINFSFILAAWLLYLNVFGKFSLKGLVNLAAYGHHIFDMIAKLLLGYISTLYRYLVETEIYYELFYLI